MNNLKNLINIFLFQFFVLFIFGSLNAKDLNIDYLNHKNLNIKAEKTFYDRSNNLFYVFYKKKLFFIKKDGLNDVMDLSDIVKKDLRTFFVFENFLVFIFKNDSIKVVNRKNGNLLWKKSFDQRIFFNPVVDTNTLFIDQGASTIISLDIKTGFILWKFENMMKKPFFYTNGRVLQTMENLIYIYSNKVLVLDKESGKKVSSINVQSSLFSRYKIRVRRVLDSEIYNNILFICYNNGSFIVLDLNYTETLWKKNKNNYKFASVYKNFLFITKKNGNFTLLNKFNGKKILTSNRFKDICITAKPYFINKDILVFGDSKGFIYFFEVKTFSVIKKMKISNSKIKKIFIDKYKNIFIFSSNNLTKLIK